MKKNMLIQKSFMVAILLLIWGCTNKTDQKSYLIPLIKEASEIVSTRPQNTSQFIAIIKLKTPALFTTTQMSHGLRTINQEQLKQINDEQDAAIVEMKKISTDVTVIYRYKMILNGLAIAGPREVFEKLSAVGLIASWDSAGSFTRPENMLKESSSKVKTLITQRNSLKFVGAEKLHQMGISGQGMKIGIIDTGIDYTHLMLGGVGTIDGYKAIDPATSAAGYPNAKVVGGVDLVGTTYNSGSAEFSQRLPKPDMNPLDEGGHGTHVAGTVAGLGDGLTSYDGMAKDAVLHAIKVFGANGSTSDFVVIAGLEYAADPNGDGDLRDQLDVVNLSLGSSYGNPKILYAEAVKNLVNGGTIAVISAGNAGNIDYIVGAPGTSTESLSVAASIDDSDHNWLYNTSQLIFLNETLDVEAIEAATTVPIAEANVNGELVYIGLADQDLTDEQARLLRGKVAFIDRGVVNFNDKIKRAVAGGAIGAVVANNRAEPSFKMGTTDTFQIPAIMITQVAGTKIKDALKNSAVKIQFNGPNKIEKPELIDRLTDFSSKGPRSMDGYLKPEISAPGSEIISAEMGGGSKVIKMSGTSMAAPHMAGIMALIKQAMVGRGLNLTALELKNVAMGTAKTISENGQRYLVSRQGSGRIQAEVAAAAELVASEPSISFGEIPIESKKAVRAKFEIKSLSKKVLNLNVIFEGNESISMNPVAAINLGAEAGQTLNLTFNLDATKMKNESIREMDGWIKFMNGTTEVYRIPVLAVAHKLSAISAFDLTILSSRSDAAGAAATVSLKNNNQNPGEALLFNLIAKDERKPVSTIAMNADCDLQTAGYKIISKKNEKDILVDVIQFGIKTYKPMTTWYACDVSILIDSDHDGLADQELLGANISTIPGQSSQEFASTLIDAKKAREIRKNFEAEIEKVKNDPDAVAKLKSAEKYDEAIIDQRGMWVHNNSTVLVIEAELSKLSLSKKSELQFQIVVSHNEQSAIQPDDYLAKSEAQTFKISAHVNDQPFLELGESILFSGAETKNIELMSGQKSGQLLILFPQNLFNFSDTISDAQSQILKPIFKN